MNRLISITLLTLAAITTSASAAQGFDADSIIEAPDTVAVIDNPSRVIITDTGSLTTVEVDGTESHPNYHFKYSVNADSTAEAPFSFTLPFVGSRLSHPSSSQITFFSYVYFGMMMPYHSPQPVRASWEYGLDLVGKRFNYRGASFGISVGIGGKEYAIRRGTVAEMGNDQLLLTLPPAGACDASSHLSMGFISVPVYYRQKIYRSLMFKLSAEMHYNFLVRGKSTYTLDNVEYTRKLSGLHQRAITPEFTFAIGSVDFAGIYLRWAPVSVFKSAYGPRISTYSIGITLSL